MGSYSFSTPASFTIFSHRAYSAFTKAANSGRLIAVTSSPAPAIAFCAAGSFSMSCVSAWIRSSTGSGVPAGATTPIHTLMM